MATHRRPLIRVPRAVLAPGGTLLLLTLLLASCDLAGPDLPIDETAQVAAEGPTWGPDGIVWDAAHRDAPDTAAKLADRAHWADGYAWANSPTAPSYTPSTFYAYNRTGGAVEITKLTNYTGRYRVRFVGLSNFVGPTHIVKVSGYYDSPNYCKPVSPRLTNDTVDIRCYTPAGTPVNEYFSVLVTRNYLDVAYGHANKTSSTDYAPPANAAWNPTGGPIRIFRDGVGRFRMVFTGLGNRTSTNGGHVQVDAVGTDKVYCNVISWGGAPDVTVTVHCYRFDGTASDSKFDVLFILPAAPLAYTWGSNPTAASYTASTYYSHNSGGSPVQIGRTSVGTYSVSFSSLSLLDGGNAQVTAYGGNQRCKPSSWGSASVQVRCFLPNGTPADAYFTVLLGS